MSEASKKAREAMHQKISRLVRTDPHQKVDASDYTPPDALDADVKTGLRPLSRRQFKRGGKVLKVEGEHARHHAGRKPRKSGGKAITADSLVNRDVREANEERDGSKHVGGFKRGGMAEKHDDTAEDTKLIKKLVKKDAIKPGMKHGGEIHADGCRCAKCSGGRMGRASGGRSMQHFTKDNTEGYGADKLAKMNKALSKRLADAGADEDASHYKSLVDHHAARIMDEDHKYKRGGRMGRKHGGKADGGPINYSENEAKAMTPSTPPPQQPSARTPNRPMTPAELKARGFDLSKPPVPRKRGGRTGGSIKKSGGGETDKYSPWSKEETEPYMKSLPMGARDDAYALNQKEKNRKKMDSYQKEQDRQERTFKAGGSVSDGSLEGTRPTGGRLARKHGGAAKGKMNVNIIIGEHKHPGAGAPPMMPPPPPGGNPLAIPPAGAMPPGLAGGMPPGGPPMPPPGMGGAPMPPMGRRAGGRVGHRSYKSPKDMDAGSGGGLGRLEKLKMYGHKA
jgi:hypothetical protein